MIKKERGVTLIVLVVTIIIMLILASIGIGAFNYNHRDVMETSENLVKSNTKQDYIDAVQMVISETQLKYATKEVDSGYFNEIIKILSDSGQFAGAVITPVYYDVTSDGVNIDEKSEKVNGIDIYTKEGFHIPSTEFRSFSAGKRSVMTSGSRSSVIRTAGSTGRPTWIRPMPSNARPISRPGSRCGKTTAP